MNSSASTTRLVENPYIPLLLHNGCPLFPKGLRLCEKSNEVSSPRKRGSKPCEHKLDSHFRGNDETGGIGFHTVSMSSARGHDNFLFKLSHYQAVRLAPKTTIPPLQKGINPFFILLVYSSFPTSMVLSLLVFGNGCILDSRGGIPYLERATKRDRGSRAHSLKRS